MTVKEYVKSRNQNYTSVVTYVKRHLNDKFRGHAKIVKHKYILDDEGIKILDSRSSKKKYAKKTPDRTFVPVSEIPTGYIRLTDYCKSCGKPIELVSNLIRRNNFLCKHIQRVEVKKHKVTILDKAAVFYIDSYFYKPSGRMITISEYAKSRGIKTSSVSMWIYRHTHDYLKGHVIRTNEHNGSYLLDEEAVRIIDDRKRRPREVFVEKEEGTMTISEYARNRNKSLEGVCVYIKNHQALFEGHIMPYKKTPNCTVKILDQTAISILDTRPQPCNPKDTMTVPEYAKAQNLKNPSTIYQYIKKHPREFNGHLIYGAKKKPVYLDKTAVELLDSRNRTRVGPNSKERPLDKVSLNEYAAIRNAHVQTIRHYIRNNPSDFEGHTERIRGAIFIDKKAIEMLDNRKIRKKATPEGYLSMLDVALEIGVTRQRVSQMLNSDRYKSKLDGHIISLGNKKYLDVWAVQYLNKQLSSPNQTLLITNLTRKKDEAKMVRLERENKLLRIRLREMEKKVESLEKQMSNGRSVLP